MGFAQAQSDYMASLGTWTHNRSDGSTAFDYGIKENVAMGMNMSVNYCIYTVWSDAVHWQTMVGYETGKVGAGVTVSGDQVYYTLNVLPGDSAINENVDEETGVENSNTSLTEYDPSNIIAQVVTSTPDEDGMIIHEVQYGETLWTIAEAYGVPIDQILRNSGLALGTTTVYEGDRLIIQTAAEPSSTPSPGPTEVPPSPTPTQPRPTMTPFPTRTPPPTQTSTTPPSVIQRTFGDGKTVGIGMIVVSVIGIILVIYLGFLKKS
jgi:LysM repeat protein